MLGVYAPYNSSTRFVFFLLFIFIEKVYNSYVVDGNDKWNILHIRIQQQQQQRKYTWKIRFVERLMLMYTWRDSFEQINISSIMARLIYLLHSIQCDANQHQNKDKRKQYIIDISWSHKWNQLKFSVYCCFASHWILFKNPQLYKINDWVSVWNRWL